MRLSWLFEGGNTQIFFVDRIFEWWRSSFSLVAVTVRPNNNMCVEREYSPVYERPKDLRQQDRRLNQREPYCTPQLLVNSNFQICLLPSLPH